MRASQANVVLVGFPDPAIGPTGSNVAVRDERS